MAAFFFAKNRPCRTLFRTLSWKNTEKYGKLRKQKTPKNGNKKPPQTLQRQGIRRFSVLVETDGIEPLTS